LRTVRPLRSVSGAITVTLVAVLLTVAIAASAASADESFGINAQFLFWSFPQSTWAKNAAMMSQDGVQVVRADALWSNVEPKAPIGGVHTYRWTTLDAIETTLANAGLRWQPIIDYSTSWAASARTSSGAPDQKSPPRNYQDYAAYAQALVARYGPGGSFWSAHPDLAAPPVTAVEIWNEANIKAFWHPEPSPSAYASLYEAARTAIHSTDPSVAAIVGASSNPTPPFLQSMYQTIGAPGRIDAVAIHPYADKPHDMYPDVADTRLVLEQHGDGSVPIDVTEFGWPTEGLGGGSSVVSDAQRGTYLVDVTRTLAQSSCGVDRIEPHTWITSEQNPLNTEEWFGVVHPNGIRSTSENDYSGAIRQLSTGGISTSNAPSATACAQQLDVRLGSTLTPAKPSQPLLPLPLGLTLRLP
jgi:hypothetical protein